MTIEDYINQLRTYAFDKVRFEGVKIITVASNDLAAKISNRVITTGENAKGGLFTPYSQRYARKRTGKGLQVTYKDFQFSGGRETMWANFGLKEITEQGNIITAVIAGQTNEAQDKINWNSAREQSKGNDAIIEPTQQELQEQIDYMQKKLTDLLKTLI